MRELVVAHGVMTAHNAALERFLSALQSFVAEDRSLKGSEEWFTVEWSAAEGAGGFFPLVVKPSAAVRDALAAGEALRLEVGGVERAAGPEQIAERGEVKRIAHGSRDLRGRAWDWREAEERSLAYQKFLFGVRPVAAEMLSDLGYLAIVDVQRMAARIREMEFTGMGGGK